MVIHFEGSGTSMSTRRLETRLSQHAREVLSLRSLPAPGEPQKQRLLYDFRYGQPALDAFPHATWSGLVTWRVPDLDADDPD